MEQFPTPESENNKKSSIFNTAAKTVLLGGALSGVAMETHAQQPLDQTIEHTVSVQEYSHLEKENAIILSNLSLLEGSMRKLSKKVSKEDVVAYSIISESEALKQAHFVSDRVEKILTGEAEYELINNESANYKVFTRNNYDVEALLSEQEIGAQYGYMKPNYVLSVYTPVDFYITVGTQLESDDTITVIVRKIDMNTKSIRIYPIKTKYSDYELGNKAEAVDAVGAQIKEKISEITK